MNQEEQRHDQLRTQERVQEQPSLGDGVRSARALLSAADAQEIQTEFVTDFNPKFMKGAANYGFSPFNEHSVGFHMDHLGEEVLDTIAYLYAMKRAFREAVSNLMSAREELDKENYHNVRRLLAKLHEQMSGS